MRYKILDQHGLNFLTLTVVEWIDLFTPERRLRTSSSKACVGAN